MLSVVKPSAVIALGKCPNRQQHDAGKIYGVPQVVQDIQENDFILTTILLNNYKIKTREVTKV
jgi:hypothetical protein